VPSVRICDLHKKEMTFLCKSDFFYKAIAFTSNLLRL
jgi:hypothetical protein